ncbi:MAG: polysaccharide pyruvyl transferase family protein [Akkermansia sp.]|nr:polysaccharide pyruvyl transferase family protein [Akkermansia sp.]
MNEKILILTHPLTGNYGGLLQAYASYTVLNALGGNAYIYRYQPDDLPVKSFNWLKYYGSLLKSILGRKGNPIWRSLYIANKFVGKLNFVDESQVGLDDGDIRYYVGSDQVWRATYCRKMRSAEYYFLNFAAAAQRRKSIAYAASFGVDEWEGNEAETLACAKLVQEFKAVSVREVSGVAICKKVLGVDAVQMPDPTLLLERVEYENIINKGKTRTNKSPLLSTYVLDKSPEIVQLLHACAGAMNLDQQVLLPNRGAVKWQDRMALTVPQWLRYIRDSKYFITDSFHGCVFAIIFNKPFVCLGNKSRGSARFDTLLRRFGLEDRLITLSSVSQLQQVLQTPIDWAQVNEKLSFERERGINFLKANLC